jgi:hypothetical protein
MIQCTPTRAVRECARHRAVRSAREGNSLDSRSRSGLNGGPTSTAASAEPSISRPVGFRLTGPKTAAKKYSGVENNGGVDPCEPAMRAVDAGGMGWRVRRRP